MVDSTCRARGVSRLAVLLAIALGLAVLVAWLLLKRGSSAPGHEAADAGAAPPAVTARATSPPTSEPGETASKGTSAQSAAATSDPTTSGIGFASTGGPQAPAPGASVATASPPAGGGSRDTGNDATPFPRYWRRCFLDPAAQDDYVIESDSSSAWSGSWAVKIASRVPKPRVAGAGLCQVFSAATLQGRRIRLTLHIRTLDAMPGAHMLFRAEGADGRLLAFYNMEPRWVSGTRDWAEYSAVLDVPAQATVVIFGGALVNAGTLWMDDALIQFVGADVAVTQGPPRGVHYNPVIDASTLPKALQNPGFEQLEGAGPAS